MGNKKTISEIALLVITVIWGLGFPITEIAINYGFGPSTIMAVRFLIASVLLLFINRRKLRSINMNLIKFGILTGVFLYLGFFFQTVGNVYTTPSKNGFITQVNIVIVPFLYMFFFRKKIDLYNIIAVTIAIVGLFVLSYNKDEFTAINVGDLYTLICAVMVAFHVVSGSYYQKKYDFDPAMFVFINILTATVLSIISAIIFDGVPTQSVGMYWPLVFLGVLNTALGFLVQSFTLKYSDATRVSLIVALESVFAAIGSVLIVNEILTYTVGIGGFLIVFAVIVNEVKPFRKRIGYIT